jgi:hypothetical protein
MSIQISNAAAKAMLDALTALGNVGGAGKLRVYSGTKPTDTDTALSGNTLLIDFALAADDFPDASDANPGATSAANSITGVNASNSGTATFFRLLNNAASAILQGTVTATGGGGDLTLTTVTVVSGAPCTVTSVTLNQSEG